MPPHELLRLFDLRRVPAVVQHHQVRAPDGPLVLFPAFQGDQLVLASPQHPGRDSDPFQQRRQTRIVHVRLPADPYRHLTVAFSDGCLLRSGCSAVDFIVLRGLGRIMETQLGHLGRGDDEDVGYLSLAGLDPAAPTSIILEKAWRQVAAISAAIQPPMEKPMHRALSNPCSSWNHV